MTQSVLIVEDEPKLAQLLSQYLEHSGYQVHCLGDGTLVEPWIRENNPDLMLLDLMLPGKDGIAICREVRSWSNIPIIMVTARVDEIDRLLGLELGADDYVCKPFSPREVVARVKAVLRRGVLDPRISSDVDNLIQYGIIRLDRERFRCEIADKEVVLTPVEFRLLEALMKNVGKVLSRTRLMDVSYEDERVVSDRTIDSHIKNLRKKISEAAPESDPIQSIYGIGYRLE